VPPVTLVVVTPLLLVNVLVVKLGLFGTFAIPVTLHLPLATTGCGAAVPCGLKAVVDRDWKRVKEPLPLS
jgi:hypothetical protein